MKIERIPILVKVVAYQVIFLMMHFLYDWFPGGITRFFGATNESMFQHMKVVFYCYLLLTGIEYGLTRRAMAAPLRYLYARLLGAVLMPLLMNIYYFTAAAYVGRLTSIPLEVVYANLVLLALSTTIFLLEVYFEQSEPARPLKWVIWILFVIVISEFVLFNQRLPWFDVFAIPPGWE